MKQIKRHSVAVVVGAALCGVFGASLAMGLGKPDSHATMGDRLSLSVPVRLDSGERLDDECVAADVYDGDDKLAGTQVRARVTLDADGAPRVLVTSSVAITEPVVTVYVMAGCQSKITRKIVALADPPGLQLPSNLAESLPVGQSRPEVHSLAAAEPTQTAAQPGRTARSTETRVSERRIRSHRQDAPRGQTESVVVSGSSAMRQSLKIATLATSQAEPDGTSKPKATKAKSPAAAPRMAADGASRLELDPVALDALSEPRLKLAAMLATTPDEQDTPEVIARRASATAYWRALQSSPEQLARDQERLVQLEQRVAELQAQQATAKAASAPLAAASGLVGVKPPVPARPEAVTPRSWQLAWWSLGGALAGGLLYVLWRARRLQSARESAWWQGDAPGPAQGGDALDSVSADAPSTTVEFVHVPAAASPVHSEPAPVFQAPAPSPTPYMPSSRQTGAQFTSMFATLPPHAEDTLRAVAVEELIDLEQQAEFFVVLGQDDAAVDLLENYVQQTPAGSPLPLLKLLDIYRRLGRRDDYERTRHAFDAAFNAHAPAWDEDLQQGHSLADYPEVVERIQALWTQPSQAMAVLEKSLTRSTQGGDTFDLPAYRELLTLYAVARDLAEGTGFGPAVDVLLPLTSADVAAMDAHGEVQAEPSMAPLMATRPIRAQSQPAGVAPALSVDLVVDLQLEDAPRHG